MAGTTGPGDADATPGGGGAAEVGWLRAHVHVGRSYPFVGVRVCRRAAPGGGIVQAFDSENPAVLEASTYAIEFARKLDRLEIPVSQLEADVSLVGPEAAVSIELRFASEATSALDETELTNVALRELRAAIAQGKWQLGKAATIRVVRMQFEPAPLSAATPGARFRFRGWSGGGA